MPLLAPSGGWPFQLVRSQQISASIRSHLSSTCKKHCKVTKDPQLHVPEEAAHTAAGDWFENLFPMQQLGTLS